MEELIIALQSITKNIDYTKEKALIDDGLLDSLDIINIIEVIENMMGIEIPPEEIDPDNFQSIEAMWELIKKIKK